MRGYLYYELLKEYVSGFARMWREWTRANAGRMRVARRSEEWGGGGDESGIWMNDRGRCRLMNER
jgi:hypothetical protein